MFTELNYVSGLDVALRGKTITWFYTGDKGMDLIFSDGTCTHLAMHYLGDSYEVIRPLSKEPLLEDTMIGVAVQDGIVSEEWYDAKYKEQHREQDEDRERKEFAEYKRLKEKYEGTDRG